MGTGVPCGVPRSISVSSPEVVAKWGQSGVMKYVNMSSSTLFKTIFHYTKVFKTATIRELGKTTKG